jgi:alpha-galactosidase
VSKVRSKGLKMGLWLAPFVVDKRAPLASEHPDWFVTGAGGKPLEVHQVGLSPTFLVLDATNPHVARHLAGLFQRLHKAGVSLFKLDFLFNAAVPGGRYDAAATGIAALRAGLETIRQAVPEAHINLCAMPVLPAVGLGHSLRYGPDIAAKGLPTGFTFTAHQARNVMLRSYLDPLVHADPDQVLLRSPATLDEARVAATLGAMAGFFTSGDDLTALPAERRRLLTRPELLALAAHRVAGRPPRLLAADSGDFVISPLADPGFGVNDPRTTPPPRLYKELPGGTGYLAVFNWSTEGATAEVDLEKLGRAGAGVREVWTGTPLTPDSGRVTLSLKPHSVALLELK